MNFNNKKHSFVRYFLMLLLGILLAQPGVFAGEKPKENVDLTLQLRWYHQFQFAGYYVAKKLGYYQQAGLNITIKAGAPNIYPVDEVISGRADFGIDNSGLLKHRSEGKPVVALAAIFQKSALRLISLKRDDIEVINDLASKSVMLLPDYGSLALIAMLYQTGLLDSVNRQASSHDIQDLIDGRTDAFNGYITNEPFTLNEMGIDYLVFDPADYDIKFYSDVLFTSEKQLSEKPKHIKAFTEASLKGWAYALEYPKHALAITHEYAPDKSLIHLEHEAKKIKELVLSDVVEIGHMNLSRWHKIMTQLKDLGLLKKEVDLENFIVDFSEKKIDWEMIRPYLMIAVALIILLVIALIFNARRAIHLSDQVEQSQKEQVKAYKLANFDHLTGLPNRLRLYDRLQLSIDWKKRDTKPFMVAFIDLDNFKLVNDEFGHDVGDKMLIELANAMQHVKRETDLLARIGGDEFILLSGDIHEINPVAISQRLLQEINHVAEKYNTSQPVSASIGAVVVNSAEAIDPEKLLKLSDLVMYEVKHTSKNDILVKSYNGSMTLDDYLADDKSG